MICSIVSTGKELSFKCKNENEYPYKTMKEKLREDIWELYCSGYDEFYLNCEYGIPLWAAEIICALKMYNPIILNIVTPYEEQTTDWCEEWRNRYFEIHEKADTIKIMHTKYQNDAYENTDKFMIDTCDAIYLFNASSAASSAEKYAKIQNKKILYFSI
jgi:uncharacterized phage-like protein YoqJ